MAQNDKFEEKKRYNAPFLRAFEFLAGEKNMNQQQMSAVIEAESSYISNLKNGKKRVGEDYMSRLVNAFAVHFEGKGHLNMDFLLGNSEYMLVENVPEAEVLDNIRRSQNPDYDVMKRKMEVSAVPAVDESSRINAGISAYIQLTNRLTDDLKRKDQKLADRIADKDAVIREKDARVAALESTIADKNAIISEKDARIAALESTVADKDAIIREKDARILTLERQLSSANLSDLTDYPFPFGAAEGSTRKHK